MGTTVQLNLRSSEDTAALERRFRAQLSARVADSSGYWIQFRDADDEDREWAQKEYGFEPTTLGMVSPPRGVGEADIDAAALALAHESGAELALTLDAEPMLLYREGVAYPLESEREFFERYVLPGFPGRVDWERLRR